MLKDNTNVLNNLVYMLAMKPRSQQTAVVQFKNICVYITFDCFTGDVTISVLFPLNPGLICLKTTGLWHSQDQKQLIKHNNPQRGMIWTTSTLLLSSDEHIHVNFDVGITFCSRWTSVMSHLKTRLLWCSQLAGQLIKHGNQYCYLCPSAQDLWIISSRYTYNAVICSVVVAYSKYAHSHTKNDIKLLWTCEKCCK